jgi:hypothetical protein
MAADENPVLAPESRVSGELFRAGHVAAMTPSARQRAPMNKVFTILPAVRGIVSNEHVEDGRTPTRVGADPHSARLALDDVEWLDRLTKLAELRESGE